MNFDFATQPLMLCVPHKSVSSNIDTALERLTERGYIHQVKLDGLRCLAEVANGKARLRSRRNDPISASYPEVIAALEHIKADVVLDGELISYGPDGKPLFTTMSWRNAQRGYHQVQRASREAPVTFVAFDVLAHNGVDLRNQPLSARLEILESLKLSGTVQLCPTTTDGKLLWTQVKKLGLEGVVAKLPSSKYTGKRTSAWVKIRETHRISAILGAVRATENRALGKIEVHVLHGEELISLGEVGTGFTEGELARLARALNAYAADPFKLPPIVVEVEFAGLYSGGILQFASYKGQRTDLNWELDCTTTQPGLEMFQ